MAIKLSSTAITTVKLGTTTVTAMYLGSTQVYSTAATAYQRQIPGAAFLNDTGSGNQAQVPGGPYTNGF